MELTKQNYFSLTEKEIESINEIDKNFPKIENISFSFNINDFRYKGQNFEKIIFRAGIMTSILSMSKNGLPLGIMITGGNNKNEYNKIKISAENGQIISKEEEQYYGEIINSNNLKETIKLFFSKLKPIQGKCIIIIGIDNRKSSKIFSDILIKGLKCIKNCSFNLYNFIPCPNLFFLTLLNQMAFQKIGLKYKMIFVPQDNYWIYLNNSFNKFHSYYNMIFKNNEKENNLKYENEINIDCSNGIVSLYKQQIINIFSNKENNFQLKINFINDNELNDNEINDNYILTNKIPKYNNKYSSSVIKNVRLSSDLDCLIYYIVNNNLDLNNNEEIKIIKGEKIIILYCKFLDFLINNFSNSLKNKYNEMIKMGIITSLYSNKAFISFFENNLKNNYQLLLVETGIQNLQKESKKFDITICYEYNGQGSIYISKELSVKFGKLSSLIETSKDSQIIELFQLFISLFNPTTSDAIANLLIIESILNKMNLSINDVYNFYEDTLLDKLFSKLKNLKYFGKSRIIYSKLFIYNFFFKSLDNLSNFNMINKGLDNWPSMVYLIK